MMAFAFIRSPIRAILMVVVLLGLHHPALADENNAGLRWGEASYLYRYNPAHEPSWLGEGKALALLQRAASGWKACGIEFRYQGVTDKAPGVMDGMNVIGWGRNGERHSAWTSWRAKRSTQSIVEADITLYANVFDDYRRRGMAVELELYKNIVHEFGHVLGLAHSDQLGDAMTVRVRTRPEWRLPSSNDLARCQEIYRARVPQL